VYETKDGRYIALGSNEARFWRTTLQLLGLREEDVTGQHDKAGWPKLKQTFADIFKTKTRDEWCEIFAGTDACFAPVLSLAEAPQHPHQAARGNFVEVAGIQQPAPAPRFSRSVPAIQSPPAAVGEHTDEVLREWGFNEAELGALRQAEAIG
ncbi:MAG: CoA transferase, partial [Proteobacteria bacterium]|nr:CoA transferase [Pseudomonadota bacterium]